MRTDNCHWKLSHGTAVPSSDLSRRRYRRIRLRVRASAALAVLWCAAGATSRGAEPPAAYAFIGGPYVITAEASGAHKFVLNFFNLSEFVIVVQPAEFIYKGASGQFYIGQVFDLPTRGTRGDAYRYSASFLLSSYAYKGLDILGDFHEQDKIAEMSVRIGAKRFYLDPITKAQFEQLDAKIADLDLKNTDSQAALRNAGLTEIGRTRSTDGTSDWDRDWQGVLLPEGLNPPRILENPEISPTEDARRTNTYGKVKLSATITRDGTIRNLSVVKGLGHGLEERAMEAIKGSWVFLPATQNGEVVETVIKFDVTFSPPKTEK
jgi:TonB family protein